ncbi:IclR family transcriptional regulator C-terminal domain-containing protein [Casimicrobium huifangae]|uniref:IclR family transcriptional regulator domain-containing protein n=1 Tax=Casimicrobium huifangae TaxID=2591109 RepID=UPI001EE242D0|nr:IclR family transcriptional regulator C-terminal domain-containing protein [Casimicrobium huifangae]
MKSPSPSTDSHEHPATPSTTVSLEVSRADMIDGLRKGLEVICAFDDTTPKLTQSELAQRLDLSRAAARRYLMTLSALGYMATDGKAFWLTPKVMRLGHSYLASARLPRTVMPVLQTLTNTIGESTNLAVLEDADAVYIGRVSAPKLLSTLIEPGTRLPAHTSAAGRLLLSYLPPDDLERWLARTPLGAFTPFTVTDKEALRRELTKVRKQGYCVTEGQFELGLRGVAVPLIDSTGAAVGAISASMAISSMTPAVSVRRCVPPLKAAAEQLRSRL